MNIWILDSSKGITILNNNFNQNMTINSEMASGLLSALNQFILVEFNSPIESIDMGGYRWIYMSEPDYNLLFVAADSKEMSAEALRGRLGIIKQGFLKRYASNAEAWKKNWYGDINLFQPFNNLIEDYYSQWIQTDVIATSAEFFDILGIFQQILNLIKKIIDKHTSDEKKKKIYNELERMFFIFLDLFYDYVD